MPAPDAASLLRRNASDPEIQDRPAVKFGDRVWTHGEYVAECHRFANLFLARHAARGGDRATHVGVLLDNTPEYLFALGGAALAGAAVVGLNHTRRDEHLLRDVRHTDCDLVISEPRHLPLLEPIARVSPSCSCRTATRTPRTRRSGSARTSTTSLAEHAPTTPASSPAPTPCGH